MSHHPRSTQQRPLTLTEELERLEQSITLTLQEIDHNFSRAHRIVTSSILPVVEQYAEHSREVWEGSKFWKQFFEASANVSLSGYEEQQQTEEEQERTVTDDFDATTRTTLETSGSHETSDASIQDIDLSNLTISPSHSSPRRPKQKQKQSKGEPSSYKSLQQDVDDATDLGMTYTSDANGPRTPSKQTSSLLDGIAITPEQSPDMQRRQRLPQPNTTQKRSDPLLHTVLDKNYRIQATPLTSRSTRDHMGRAPASANRPTRAKKAQDFTLDSSPLAPPELHAEVFDSPIRREITQHMRPQATPGISVLTPGKGKQSRISRNMNVWDSDDDDDGIDEATGMPYGASPPKTMQFHIPQNRLLKTPAREASKQIVDNILASAGVGREEDHSDDFEVELDLTYDDNELDQNSPSVIRKAAVEDETF